MRIMSMSKRSCLASLVIMGAMGATCMGAIAEAPRAARPAAGAGASAASIAPYRTELFNLVRKEPNILDGKVYYQPDFARQFDALLAGSRLVMADKAGVPMKKRLLSGPAEPPSLQRDPATGRQWLLYEACQAHRCNEVSLLLLYDTVTRRMVGKLQLDKQSELLGAPSAGEERLLVRAS